MNRPYAKELEVMAQLAREAGGVILQVYATDFQVRLKGRNDPVTEADERASSLIVAGLREAFPQDLVVSEEEPIPQSGAIPFRVWYVDPLDGTKEFISKNGEFAVMIGLAVEGRAQVGLVYQPVGQVVYGGMVGQGAWVEREGRRTPVQVTGEHELGRLRLVVSRSHRLPVLDAMRAALGLRSELRRGSVGLKVAALVEHEADLYLDPSNMTKAWDTCGPEAVLVGAGGRMTDLLGAPLVYSPQDVRNRRGFVASNGTCHDAVLAAIKPIVRERASG